jgi:WD40 repeat protein
LELNQRAPKDLYGDPVPSGTIARLGTRGFRHGHEVNSLVFSADGNKLASLAEFSATIALWEVPTGKEISRLEVPGTRITSIAWSPDSRRLASCSQNGTIQIWDASGKRRQPLLEIPDSGVECVAFSPDGRTLASGGTEVQFWDPLTGKHLRALEVRSGWNSRAYVSAIVFSPDGESLAATTSDKVISVWSILSARRIHRFPNPSQRAPKFIDDGKILAGVGRIDLVFWDMASGKEALRLGHQYASGNPSSDTRTAILAVSPDGRTFATAGTGLSIAFWDTRTQRQIREARGPNGPVLSLAYSPDGETLASGNSNGTICLWGVRSAAQLSPARGHQCPISSIAISPTGELLASGSLDHSIRIWDVRTTKQTRRLDGHLGPVASVAFSPDGQLLGSADHDGRILLWEIATRHSRELGRHQMEAAILAFSPDGKTLASGGRDRTIRIWDIQTGSELVRIQGKGTAGWVHALAFSPDGKLLASGGTDKIIYLWEPATGKKLGELRSDDFIFSLAFLPDSQRIVAGSFRNLRLWDVSTRSQIHSFKGHDYAVTKLVLSQDGKMLASIGDDFKILLWEVATGKTIRRIDGMNVRSVAFSPNVETLACGGDGDFAILIWDLTGLLQDGRIPAIEPTPSELAALWDDLQSIDAGLAHRSLWKLVAGGPTTVKFIRGRLSPINPVPKDRLDLLTASLDSADFAVRKKATDELERLGRTAQPILAQLVASQTSPEVRRQVQRLLDKLDPIAPEPLRAARAVTLLERLGTPEATALLEKLAQGAPGAWLTEDARASVKRLEKRAKSPQRQGTD